ncbi:proteolipid protein 2-like [Stegostoma tigrinum]|uniref:proteolipid protein 2-like n=1 Tax=Stegostoma tigrinum TaxID=3053191 RepID=UPI00287057F5|nr:proteolipid protein 2-like [Stegostoma tigrinum]
MESEDRPSDPETLRSRFWDFGRTMQGVLLFIEMLLCLAVASCCLAARSAGAVAAPLVELCFSGMFYWVYVRRYDRENPSLEWRRTDMFRCVSSCVIFLTFSLMNIPSGGSTNSPGRVFAILCIPVFLCNIYLLHPKASPRDSQPVMAKLSST